MNGSAPTGSCEVACAKPYPYQLPLGRTAVVMIDFQRDFIYEGGFGAALGNDVALLKVRAVHAACGRMPCWAAVLAVCCWQAGMHAGTQRVQAGLILLPIPATACTCCRPRCPARSGCWRRRGRRG
jgi:hypothetical protein